MLNFSLAVNRGGWITAPQAADERKSLARVSRGSLSPQVLTRLLLLS